MIDKNTYDNIIELPKRKTIENDNRRQMSAIINDLIDMLFEMAISFVPIILYCLFLGLSNKKIDIYEHFKNGSIIWIFIAMMVSCNFKIMTNSKNKTTPMKKVIFSAIIILMLVMTGLYLMLNFTTYNFIKVEFCRDNVEWIVLMLCIATILINVMRIVFIREGNEE